MYSSNVKSENEGGREKLAALRQIVWSREKEKHAKQLMLLQQQERIIEKNLSSFIDNVKAQSLITQSISLDHINMSTKREQTFQSLVKNVRDVLSEMKAVQSTVSNLREIQRLDVNEYKKKLVNLSCTIEGLKSSFSLRRLSDEQIILDRELKEVGINFERCTSSKDSKFPVAAVSSRSTSGINGKYMRQCNEIDEFYKLLAKTGRTENWTSEDHLLFLRKRKKCKTIPALVAAVQTECPDLSAETIINHEAWYTMYLNMRENQRRGVNEWRIQRKADKSRKKYSDNEDRLGMTTGIKTNDTKFSNRVKLNYRMEKTLLIEKWRTDKVNKCAANDDRAKSELQSKRAVEAKRRQARQRKNREMLHEYRTKRQLSSTLAVSKGQVNRNDQFKRDATLILAFRQQDRDYVKRKAELVRRAKKSSQVFSSTLVRRNSMELRNSTTLFNVTKVWSQKCKENFLSKPIDLRDSLYIKDIPKKCVRWRNEESVELNA